MLYLFLTGLGLATAVTSTGLGEGDIPMVTEKTLYTNEALVEEESEDDQGALPDILVRRHLGLLHPW